MNPINCMKFSRWAVIEHKGGDEEGIKVSIEPNNDDAEYNHLTLDLTVEEAMKFPVGTFVDIYIDPVIRRQP